MSTPLRLSRRTWEIAATEAALNHGVPVVSVLAGSRKKQVVKARWDAWVNLFRTRRYSISAIAQTTGFHHTSIMYAIRRADGLSSQEARGDRACRSATEVQNGRLVA